ncbi:hypothetical protein KUV46_15635 [Thalassovita mediterranea]|nr:hypothetical protein KUV46_15635 [Thalassovita mediterranea]
MANAKTWPSSLKKPLLSSANVALDFGYESSEMEAGTLLQRQIYPEPTGRRNVEIHVTTFELARAVDFLRNLNGASFDMPLSVPGDPDTSRPTVSARFLGGANHQALDGDSGLLSFNVFIEALPEPQADGYFEYFDELEGDFDAYWQALENLVNNHPA